MDYIIFGGEENRSAIQELFPLPKDRYWELRIEADAAGEHIPF